MYQNLTGQTAVVDGRHSGGIGGAIARQLAEAGARLVLHGRRNRDRVESLAEEIRGRGGQATVELADLADTAQAESLVSRTWATQHGVDIWVNNAGADVLTGDAATLSFQDKLALLWQVDVQGTILLSRDVGQRMKQAGRGTILNLGWDQAVTGMEGDSGELFAATKGAIMAFTGSLARSLAPNVRVNCLAPGWIRTSWGDQATEYWQAAYDSRVAARPLGYARGCRAGRSVSGFTVCRFYLPGQILPVNGGFAGSAAPRRPE